MTYRIAKAHYAKGMMAIHCESNGSGWKTPEMYIAEAMGRWSNRDGAYIVSPNKAKAFPLLVSQGWRGSIGWGREPAKLIPPGGDLAQAMTFREAIKLLKGVLA